MMMTFRAFAEQLNTAIEQRTRDNGQTFYCLKDGASQWMKDAIREAHGERLPNDTIYSLCARIAYALADEGDEPDPSDIVDQIEADIYTSDLTTWLAADVTHIHYCNEYIDEAEDVGTDIIAMIQGGQLLQIHSVGMALIGAIEAQVESQEEAE